MTQKRPEISRTGGLVRTDDILHAWCEAKETKEIVCSTIPVQYRCYTYLRGGGEYEREKRRLSTALNCLYSSLYYMTYLCAVSAARTWLAHRGSI